MRKIGATGDGKTGDLVVARAGEAWTLTFGSRSWPCAIGRGGARREKQEADGATPVGCWPLRRVLYRPDRLAPPATRLPIAPLAPKDGWCDDPADPRYNRPVRRPYPAGHEALWREDGIYDLIVVLGYNDRPVRAGRGSAIFLHIARPGFALTEGCIALRRADLLALLEEAGPGTKLSVRD